MLFTCEDCLGDRSIEQYTGSEGEAPQWHVEKCNRYHVFKNKKRGGCGTKVTELLEKI